MLMLGFSMATASWLFLGVISTATEFFSSLSTLLALLLASLPFLPICTSTPFSVHTLWLRRGMGGAEYALTAEEANSNAEAMILSCLRLRMVDVVCFESHYCPFSCFSL